MEGILSFLHEIEDDGSRSNCCGKSLLQGGKQFFDISVRLPLDDFTGKRVNVDRLLKKTTKSISGRLDLLQRLIQFQKIKRVS